MRVVVISFSQFLQLQYAQKSFITLVCGSWQTRHQAEWIEGLERRIGSHSCVLFKLIVEVNSEAEEYHINTLGLRSLPSLVLFSNGELQNVISISTTLTSGTLAECHNSKYMFEELTKYKSASKSVSNLFCSAPQSPMLSSCMGQLFLSGDRSSVGKSSMCLAILVSLLRKGVPPSALAYIKPVTQCEAEQPVTLFCNRVGITNRGIGPVVFYKGFTRAYLNGETAPAHSLLEEAHAAVMEISQGKAFTLVDGVGYPSVGSICNLSNADVARQLNAPVLLIGKSGVGDAVDSYNLNSAYFELKGVRVLGGVFNKLPLDGYYSLDNCKDAVTMYFEQFKPHEMPYGFVPTIVAKPSNQTTIDPDDTGSSDSMDVSVPVDSSNTTNCIELTEFETQLSDALLAHVDLDRLMHDVWMYEILKHTEVTSQRLNHSGAHNIKIVGRSAEALQRTYALLEQQIVATNLLLKGLDSTAAVGAFDNDGGGGPSRQSVTSNSSGARSSQQSTLNDAYAMQSSVHLPAPVPNGQSYTQLHTRPYNAPQTVPLVVPVPVTFDVPPLASPLLASSVRGGKPYTIGSKRSREEVEQEARKQGASGG